MKVYQGENVPIKSWCENPEPKALDQALNLSALPFVFRQVCLMPDTHMGYGMPIGGVIACKNVIIPNAVGVDIGCGMCTTKTSLKKEDLSIDTLKRIMGVIRKVVPVGRKHHKEAQDESLMPKPFKGMDGTKVVSHEHYSALHQLGTLGSGNHFIEIQTDGTHIWIMIHSGSRNLGFKVAKYYNNLAYELNTKWHSNTFLPKNKEDSLAFFPLDSEEGEDYLNEMNYCVEFALANRKIMLYRIMDVFKNMLRKYDNTNIGFEPMINIAHNYAKIENHFGHNLIIHRKGATKAYEGEIGIIPGSQGTASYIVKGKGYIESFKSCSHGAGRTMSRTKARENLVLEDEKKKLDDLGIVHNIRTQKDLDEASSAYKDIDIVMEEQKDLVEIVTKLSPLGVIKG